VRAALLLAAAALAVPGAARAHHGVAAVGVAGPEGPGAALETTSPLPLPGGALLGLVKSEAVPYQRFAAADPENKRYALFSCAVVGYGIRPWLSAYVVQPVNVKAQDGAGTNAGAGDPGVMLTLGLKWDEGLRLVPERESLDDLEDWHLSTWAASTIPLASTTRTGRDAAPFAPDMQLGFGSPSVTGGVAIMKQSGPDLTWLADASHQRFFPHTYPFTRYQFGGETRVNGAAAVRVVARPGLRVDVVPELNGLYLERDRERIAAGDLAAVRASGGAVLYAGLGVRVFLGRLSAAAGLRRAALKRLNEQPEQQGSEGLELLRATLSLSATVPL
jgi:hypothetical protein